MQRLILGAIALLAWMPLAGEPQREDAAIQARIDEGPRTVRIAVDPSDVRAEVPRTLYGTGMEDVNHEIYGGLDAQRLYDESFEEQEIEPVAGQGVRPKPM